MKKEQAEFGGKRHHIMSVWRIQEVESVDGKERAIRNGRWEEE